LICREAICCLSPLPSLNSDAIYFFLICTLIEGIPCSIKLILFVFESLLFVDKLSCSSTIHLPIYSFLFLLNLN
jgi:hypothetical protein